MSFPYNPNVPNPPDNPSQDVPAMLTNAGTINQWVGIDHVGFGNSLGGQHKQVTFPQNITPTPPISLGSVVYTQPGTADATSAQIYWQNRSLPFALSCVRAYAFATVSGGVVTLQNSFNIGSVTYNSVGNYTVNLTSGCVSGTNYGILSTANRQSASPFRVVVMNYDSLTSTSFALFPVAIGGSPNQFPFDPSSFTIVVWQL